MDISTASANPPTKTPVQRGARACTVCRQAKMKCVGAEDGTKRCQRCQRSGAECVFEKHRRGRKPGSKLSEASKMLRRLEKGLNNAKAKQPPSNGLAQPSSSTSTFAHDEPSGSNAYHSSHNNPTHSGQQSDDEMDEDEEDRTDEPLGAIYPARAIRSSIRSSFLDVVMNKEPPEHSPPHSASPTDRTAHLSPKVPSQTQSLHRLLRPHPKDPVQAGIISEQDVQTFFDAFFLRLNPFVNLFDPYLHTPNYVRQRSPFLFTAMLMACCKFFRPTCYQDVRRLAHEWCVFTFAEGIENVETVQALACMTYWKEPQDRRTWTYIGMACRMAVGLRLNRFVGPRQVNESDIQLLERRNKERTYLVLFVHDRSLSMQTGKHWMLPEDDLVRGCRGWHEEGAMGQRPETRPEDVIVAAFVNLRLIGSAATDTFYSHNHHQQPDMFESELHKYNSKLDDWRTYWTAQMEKSPLADPFHTHFLLFFQSHVRTFLNTFGLNLMKVETSRTMPNMEAVRQCFQSARTSLQIVSKDFAGTHVLRYGQESITVMSAYAAIVLLKLLRNPSTMIQLRENAEDIHAIINRTADAYQNASHVTGSELDSAAYHARFLRRLTVMDQERARQQPERNGFRSDGVPPSFAQGLPPIRTSQPSLGMLASHTDAYSAPRIAPQHGATQPQLAPLAIPGSQTMHPFSAPTHIDYGMDSAVRTGMVQGATRGPSYPTVQHGSEDDSYFQYMLGEVGVAGEALFSRGDGTPPAGTGFMGNGNMHDFSGYGAPQNNHYRDQAPMQAAFGHGQAHHRSASFHQSLPSMQYHTSNGFDGSR
ncbi:fungal-specific transcription factor domain-containing protein [Fomes fomentarius]|nr:fungal-specific transcription factor domain-containing protein [Fomes fomentarius]